MRGEKRTHSQEVAFRLRVDGRSLMLLVPRKLALELLNPHVLPLQLYTSRRPPRKSKSQQVDMLGSAKRYIKRGDERESRHFDTLQHP